VSVVAGVGVHADSQFLPIANRIAEIFDHHVPADIRDGFIFHATEVYSGGKKIDRSKWPFEQRKALIEAMVQIPRLECLSLSFGTSRNSFQLPEDSEAKAMPHMRGLTPIAMNNVMAFIYMAGQADKDIRNHADPNEIGMFICENNDIHRYIQVVPEFLRENPHTLYNLRWTSEEFTTGALRQSGEISISRIIEIVSFASKKQSPHLQVADACAFAFRAYLSEHKDGSRFAAAMLEVPPPLRDFDGDGNGVCYSWERTPPSALSVR
jgi:hypothetical protein